MRLGVRAGDTTYDKQLTDALQDISRQNSKKAEEKKKKAQEQGAETGKNPMPAHADEGSLDAQAAEVRKKMMLKRSGRNSDRR